MRRSINHRERQALCDLALELGALAPTLAGVNVDQLVSALLRAERRKDRKEGFEAKVAQLRRSPLFWRPVSLMTIVVAHEDIRRARGPGIPIARRLSQRDDDTLWRDLKRRSRRLWQRHGAPIVLQRSDPPKSRWVAVKGDDPVIISGKPLELVLAAHGRRNLYNVAWEGSRQMLVRRGS